MSQQQASQTPGVGHNRPSITEGLSDSTRALAAEVEALAKLANEGPAKIETEDDLAKVAAVVKGAKALFKTVDERRVEEKEPHLRAGKEVDEFFRGWTDRLARIRDAFQKRGDDYQRAKDAERRRLLQIEQQKQDDERRVREEAARKSEEAGRTAQAEKHTAKAEEAALAASRAQQEAKAPAADLVTTHLASGDVVSAKTPWVFEVEDYRAIDYAKLSVYFKAEHVDAAMKLFIKAGGRTMPGAKIFQQVTAVFK